MLSRFKVFYRFYLLKNQLKAAQMNMNRKIFYYQAYPIKRGYYLIDIQLYQECFLNLYAAEGRDFQIGI